MPELTRQQKITFGEMRESGVDRILIYCADYKCSHSIEMRRSLAGPCPAPTSSRCSFNPRFH